jgi:hypothetical protein
MVTTRLSSKLRNEVGDGFDREDVTECGRLRCYPQKLVVDSDVGRWRREEEEEKEEGEGDIYVCPWACCDPL